MTSSDPARTRAEALFKRKERESVEGAQAWAEYEAKRRATTENMQRLRELRLAKQAADLKARTKGSKHPAG
jgi:hypothetical protein